MAWTFRAPCSKTNRVGMSISSMASTMTRRSISSHSMTRSGTERAGSSYKAQAASRILGANLSTRAVSTSGCSNAQLAGDALNVVSHALNNSVLMWGPHRAAATTTALRVHYQPRQPPSFQTGGSANGQQLPPSRQASTQGRSTMQEQWCTQRGGHTSSNRWHRRVGVMRRLNRLDRSVQSNGVIAMTAMSSVGPMDSAVLHSPH